MLFLIFVLASMATKFLTCTLCLETKEETEFFRDAARKTGRSTRCKLCYKIRRYMKPKGRRGNDNEVLKILGKTNVDTKPD